MKLIKPALVSALLISLASSILAVRAADGHDQHKTKTKGKPYPLKTCVVSDEKLGGDMGEPYVFTSQGREIKLCCKSCLKDFNKQPARFIKKLEAAEKAGTGTPQPDGPAHKHGQHQH